MITPDEVRHVASLARLKLTDDEVERFSRELSAILQAFDELAALDTRGVLATQSTGSSENVWREDEVAPFGDPTGILEQAPMQDHGSWRVPGVR